MVQVHLYVYSPFIGLVERKKEIRNEVAAEYSQVLQTESQSSEPDMKYPFHSCLLKPRGRTATNIRNTLNAEFRSEYLFPDGTSIWEQDMRMHSTLTRVISDTQCAKESLLSVKQ